MASDALQDDGASPSQVARVPRDFHHPYTPYAIQETFMSTVYQVLDEGKIGILESPTGTVSSNCSLISPRDYTLLPLRRLEQSHNGMRRIGDWESNAVSGKISQLDLWSPDVAA
jgi:hypothetical protein